MVCSIHKNLDEKDMFCGAQSIYWELKELNIKKIPGIRTIDRILFRNSLTRKKEKHESKGVKYPVFNIEKTNQMHQLDFVGPRYLSGGFRFYSMNVVDLATRRCATQPLFSKNSQSVLDALWSVWKRLGIPKVLQVDNEAVFYGSQRYPRGMGSVIRLCLANQSSVLFIPPSEPWRNGVVERFNDHYQQKLLNRKTILNPEELFKYSLEFEQKFNSTFRLSALNGKTPLTVLKNMNSEIRFPAIEKAPLHRIKKPEDGKYHLIRFIKSNRKLNIFGEIFKMSNTLIYEYVIATINVKEQKLLVYDSNKYLIEKHDYKLR